MPMMKREGKKVSPRYRGKCGRYSNGESAGRGGASPRVRARFRRKIGETLLARDRQWIAAFALSMLFTGAMLSVRAPSG